MSFLVFLNTILGLIFFQSSLEGQTSNTLSKLALSKKIDEREYHSQVGQDKFVYSILYGLLDKQDKGYYVEVGAGQPIHINNSYFFEKNFQWNGVSIDISDNLNGPWQAVRKNRLLSEDATQAEYSAILNVFPSIIDALSLDIDG